MLSFLRIQYFPLFLCLIVSSFTQGGSQYQNTYSPKSRTTYKETAAKKKIILSTVIAGTTITAAILYYMLYGRTLSGNNQENPHRDPGKGKAKNNNEVINSGLNHDPEKDQNDSGKKKNELSQDNSKNDKEEISSEVNYDSGKDKNPPPLRSKLTPETAVGSSSLGNEPIKNEVDKNNSTNDNGAISSQRNDESEKNKYNKQKSPDLPQNKETLESALGSNVVKNASEKDQGHSDKENSELDQDNSTNDNEELTKGHNHEPRKGKTENQKKRHPLESKLRPETALVGTPLTNQPIKNEVDKDSSTNDNEETHSDINHDSEKNQDKNEDKQNSHKKFGGEVKKEEKADHQLPDFPFTKKALERLSKITEVRPKGILEAEEMTFYVIMLKKYANDLPDPICSYINQQKPFEEAIEAHQTIKEELDIQHAPDSEIKKRYRSWKLFFEENQLYDQITTSRLPELVQDVQEKIKTLFQEKIHYLDYLSKIKSKEKRAIKTEIVKQLSPLCHRVSWEFYQKIKKIIVNQYKKVEKIIKKKIKKEINQPLFKQVYYRLLIEPIVEKELIEGSMKEQEKEIFNIFMKGFTKPLHVTIGKDKKEIQLEKTNFNENALIASSMVKLLVIASCLTELGDIGIDEPTKTFAPEVKLDYFLESQIIKVIEDHMKHYMEDSDYDVEEEDFDKLRFAFFQMINFHKLEEGKKVMANWPMANFWYEHDEGKVLIPKQV